MTSDIITKKYYSISLIYEPPIILPRQILLYHPISEGQPGLEPMTPMFSLKFDPERCLSNDNLGREEGGVGTAGWGEGLWVRGA